MRSISARRIGILSEASLSIRAWPQIFPVVFHNPPSFSRRAVPSTTSSTNRSRGGRHRTASIAAVGVDFMAPVTAKHTSLCTWLMWVISVFSLVLGHHIPGGDSTHAPYGFLLHNDTAV